APRPWLPWLVRCAHAGPPDVRPEWRAGRRENWKMSLGMVATMLDRRSEVRLGWSGGMRRGRRWGG
ncbi:hypothetical protein LTR66_012368, partial [Elasticomyces elasticus]